jgi:hypothetical protein
MHYLCEKILTIYMDGVEGSKRSGRRKESRDERWGNERKEGERRTKVGKVGYREGILTSRGNTVTKTSRLEHRSSSVAGFANFALLD